MPAPSEIIDALESVIDIFLSGVRHRERAAFILCDNLVEMTCKMKAKQHDRTFNTRCNFHDAWNAPGVHLPPTTLGRKVNDFHNTRNNMQHGSAAATVDITYCATAIITAIKVIDRCWRNTSRNQFPLWMHCAVRIIRLYSEEGETGLQMPFETRMLNLRWRSDDRTSVRINELQIELGHRNYWQFALRAQPGLVEECLNELGIP